MKNEKKRKLDKEEIIMFLLGGLSIMSLLLGFTLRDRHMLLNENKGIKILPKVVIKFKEDLTVPFLSEVKVSDFIENITATIVDDYTIDTSILGKKEINFELINEDNKKFSYSFNINIIDNTPPVVLLEDNYTVIKGSEISIANKIICGDDVDENPKCEIIGDYDMNKSGVYPLKFYAEDKSGNVTSKSFNLTVVNPRSNGYISFNDVQSVYKNADTEIGIDISEWQDTPDFDKLAASGVEFIMLRVGTSRGTNGSYYLDKSFKYNIENANRVGIPVGVYFYSYASTKEQALKDAQWVYEQIKDYNISLPITFDWEDWSYFSSYNISFNTLTNIANTFLDFFKEKGYDTLLYSSKLYLEQAWQKVNHPIWLAHYTQNLGQSTYQGEYTYWQICDDGRIDGIEGDVDFNIRYRRKGMATN